MSLRIARLGPFARRFLEMHEIARVSAVFARSFHLEANDDALCVVDATLGNGALNAVLAQSFSGAAAPVIGSLARIAPTAIVTGDLHLDADAAEDWRPAPARISPRACPAFEALIGAALAAAPEDGAFRPGLDDGCGASSPIQRALRDRTRAFAGWLVSGEGAPPVSGLVGLGSGLTPAGDDFVGGAMIALRLAGRPDKASAIWSQVEALGAGATTVLSRAMLRAAAEGIGGEALHEVLAALAAGDQARFPALLAAVDRIGHTSGWDALAGALAALGASFGGFQPARPGTAPGGN